ncbi:type II toxin-antitoxin system HicA family toxin [Candidatus Nephthysia bennettiae]|uniref:Type II toxin-antitoxin system HicA family toxin n=1 Tax=Candidatus Nephthysia bennettiae TaxID=3127016 RepID=A0A934NDK7_9BACT|nr:type II toxin-antitoxin system HicA family toxin [Candidatus Dormibacteraeota bacterium]MBJ7614380.1 type II toxin-antitoxin system HicA family toxin [Candidatus Dormibacteraeota bacterium]
MAKARQVRAALERDGWRLVRQTGSHRLYRKGEMTAVFAFHDREDIGGPMMARIARQFGYTLEELRRMV